MEQALEADPASLARVFAKPASQPKTGAVARRPSRSGRPRAPPRVSRFDAEGAHGILVEIRARDATGKRATTAILHGREGGSPRRRARRQQRCRDRPTRCGRRLAQPLIHVKLREKVEPGPIRR